MAYMQGAHCLSFFLIHSPYNKSLPMHTNTRLNGRRAYRLSRHETAELYPNFLLKLKDWQGQGKAKFGLLANS